MSLADIALGAVAKGVSRRSTPWRLRLSLGVIVGLTALLLLWGEATLDATRTNVNTMGRDAAPSILAAQEIGVALADLDANVANSFLGNADHVRAANEAVELRRTQATDHLIAAAENITYGDQEKVPIQTMLEAFGRYLEIVAGAHVRADLGDARGALAAYGTATALMHGTLLRAANELDAANSAYFDRAYASQRSLTATALAFSLGLGCSLLAVLAGVQWFLYRRTRRILNPALVGATVCALALVGLLVAQARAADHDLRVAAVDAFKSIEALVRARTVAYDLNGDESRWLLAPRDLPDFGREAFAQSFTSRVAQLTSNPAADRDVTGLLGDELRNITFEGEGDQAQAMVRAFGVYMQIDGTIRRMEATGDHAGAVELCIGARPDESNAAFDRFDAAVLATVRINRAAFDQAIARESRLLAHGEWEVPFLSLAIALLASYGLWLRLREYRG